MNAGFQDFSTETLKSPYDNLKTDAAPTLPETNRSHLKMDGWNTDSFPFGMPSFQVLC